MYADGEGVPLDDAEAVRWYHLAAEQGHATAQHNLGVAGRAGPLRNILDHLPTRQRPWVQAIVRRAYQASDVREVEH